MIIPFPDVIKTPKLPTQCLVNSAKELLSFTEQLVSYCDDDEARVHFMLRSQDIITRIETMAAELLSYKAKRAFENLARRG